MLILLAVQHLHVIILLVKQMCDMPDEVQKRGAANEIAMQAHLQLKMHHQMT